MGNIETDPVLAGGGEMGALMRSVDWSKTAVGPVAWWPQSLRTVIGILLESKFGMMVAWGPRLTHFYNDAYRPILGTTKHPSLGKSVPDVFPEIWTQIGPLFDQVMAGHAVNFDDLLVPLDRHGFLEECYFTFCYCPIRDENHAVGGIVVTVTESTTRVVNERRLRMLRDLATSAAETKPEAQAWRDAAHVLDRNDDDVPFALLYALDEEGAGATLLGSTTTPDPRIAVQRVALDGTSGGWPIEAALRSGAALLVDDVDTRFGAPVIGRKWPEPVRRALLLPLRRPGTAVANGVAIIGLNPRGAFDDATRDFCGVAAEQVATAVASSRAYAEERRRAEALTALDRAKTAFFSNVSHELRTPLTLILGPVEQALGATDLTLAGEDLHAVHRNAQRLLKLVNALLEFSRVEAGRAQPSYRLIDLAALTRQLASAFDSALDRAGLRLEVDCPSLPAAILVDPAMWETIVLNLISNAFKFTMSGTIAVKLRAVGEVVELSVSDTGHGIPAEELPHVFDRFRTVAGVRGRSQEGSGIGLALVKDLVQLHDGRVSVESRLGEGTTFAVAIPLQSGQPTEDSRGALDGPAATAAEPYVTEALRWLAGTAATEGSELTPRETPSAGELGASAAHVLVVDDNADMREYVTRILRPHWSVETAADGQQALAAIERRRPDLVLTDIMLPLVDGFALLQTIRAIPPLAGLPVIMLSARAGEESRVEGLHAGADDYLVKPFSGKELKARVATHLELGRLRRQAEAERRKLYEQFMQAPVPMSLVTGPELTFALANPQYLQMVGRADVVGKPFREVFAELPDDAPVFRMLEEVYRTGRPFSANEYRVPLDRDGSGRVEDVFFKFTCQPVRDSNGVVEGVMTVAIDITPQIVANRQLESLAQSEQKARADAELANRAKDEFLAILGHELRNPLAPMRTALRLIQQRGFRPEDSAVLERQVSALVRLVDDLLDVSRIARGKVDLRRRRLELATVVQNGLETASPLLEQGHHRVDLQVSPKGLAIDGDADRLSQVVSNLLTNAAKYSEPGTEIHVVATKVGGQVRLSVRDHGIGIPPEMLTRVFEMFVQQPQSLDRAAGGIGLGLTIVRNLVMLHGGTASAHSEGPGKGSEFVIELPLAADLAGDAALHGASTGKTVDLPKPNWARILVVDDNQDAAETLGEFLGELGHEVELAHDAPAALDVARRFRPTICLLDIGLPVMDGYELAKRLREVDGMPPDVRLVAITGYGQDSDRLRSSAAGFDGHLVKPIDLDDLVKELSQ